MNKMPFDPIRRGLIRSGCVLLLAIGLPVLRAQAPEANAGLRVEQGWIRWLPGGVPQAGYFVLVNDSNRERTLVAATSPRYGMVQLHESSTSADGNSMMREVKQVTVAAGGEVRFAPGGYHLMMMQPDPDIEPGDEVAVALNFADGTSLEVNLTVRPPTVIQ